LLCRHDSVEVHEQDREDGPLLTGPERQLQFVGAGPERTEDPKIESGRHGTADGNTVDENEARIRVQAPQPTSQNVQKAELS
jgi:hypothetical protein